MSNFIFKNWQHFATFPCKGNSKIPAVRNGFKDAQFGQNVTVMLNAGDNAAMACEKSGVIVIDCDVDEAKGYNGLITLKSMEAQLGELPSTLTQATPRGGRHFIFSSKGIRSPRGKIGNDIDVKYNGYIMIAPSSINGKPYEIIDGVDENGNFVLAEIPQAWLNYLNKSGMQKVNAAQKFKEDRPRRVYSEVDIEKMFKNCRFLTYCADVEHASCLPEPMWHSMVTVLSQIDGAEDLIHQLSEPHWNYSFEETQSKIEYAKQFGHSQSCVYISSNYPEICKNCKSSISQRLV